MSGVVELWHPQLGFQGECNGGDPHGHSKALIEAAWWDGQHRAILLG